MAWCCRCEAESRDKTSNAFKPAQGQRIYANASEVVGEQKLEDRFWESGYFLA